MLRMNKRDSRDIIGGMLVTAIGLFFVIYAQRYSFGSLTRMGPGYFPVVLGGVLTVLGVLVALPAWFRTGTAPSVNWKNFLFVIGSVLAFGAALQTLGLIFATMITVVIASMADKDITWRGRGMLAVAVALITYLIIITGLSMVLPIWPWSY